MSIAQNYPEIKPSLNLDFANVKKLDSRVTFARASEGRYYDGRSVAKAEENLILRSQEFDNGIWAKFRATVSADDTTAPDGTTTADKLIANTDNNSHGCSIGVVTVKPATAYTYSVYAKSAGYDWLFLQGYDASNGGTGTAYFNLSAGTVGTTTGTITASIVSAGNGWYRCIIQIDPSEFTAAAVHNFYAQVASADTTNSFAGDGTSGIYLWGYQVEQRSAVSAYTPTTTQPITNYIPVLQTAANNVARFDHDPVTGESLGLLVEEQRTNLLLRSEEFDNASWSKTSVSVDANTVIAPDGTLSGDKLYSSSGVQGYLSQAPNVTSGTAYTVSLFARSANKNSITIYLSAAGGDKQAAFNVVTGETGFVSSGVTATITPSGNGWYRCSLSFTAVSTGVVGVRLYPNGDPAANGNGYSGIFIWGAQLETGAFPTSYIPTTSSQVTRSADAASMTGTNFSEWYSQGEGSLFVEANQSNAVLGRYAQIWAGGTNQGGYLSLANDGDQAWLETYNGVVANVFSPKAPIGQYNGKLASGFDLTGNTFAFNGSIISTSTNYLVNPKDANSLFIGQNGTSIQLINGHIKKIAYYPKRLSNANLQALTGS